MTNYPSYFLTLLNDVKTKIEISSNFVAFSENLNFNRILSLFIQPVSEKLLLEADTALG
jgi:hypothetical protein